VNISDISPSLPSFVNSGVYSTDTAIYNHWKSMLHFHKTNSMVDLFPSPSAPSTVSWAQIIHTGRVQGSQLAECGHI
jgi:hypothetical protein